MFEFKKALLGGCPRLLRSLITTRKEGNSVQQAIRKATQESNAEKFSLLGPPNITDGLTARNNKKLGAIIDTDLEKKLDAANAAGLAALREDVDARSESSQAAKDRERMERDTKTMEVSAEYSAQLQAKGDDRRARVQASEDATKSVWDGFHEGVKITAARYAARYAARNKEQIGTDFSAEIASMEEYVVWRKAEKAALRERLGVSVDAPEGDGWDVAEWMGKTVVNESWQGIQFVAKALGNDATFGLFNDTLSPLDSSYHSLIGEEGYFGTPDTIAGGIGQEGGAIMSWVVDPVAVVTAGMSKVAKLRVLGRVPNSTLTQRPSWRQSEIDVTAPLEQQGFRTQISFKDGVEVPYGTKGSTRPEAYREGLSVEVKNYNVATSQGRSNLVRNVSKQAQHRAQNLPANTAQQVNIDVRGQTVTRTQLNETIERMVERSNGALRAEDINILR